MPNSTQIIGDSIYLDYRSSDSQVSEVNNKIYIVLMAEPLT